MKLAIALCFVIGIGLLAWYLVLEGQKRQEAKVQESLKDLYHMTATPAEELEETAAPTEESAATEAVQEQEPTVEPAATPKVMAERFAVLYETNSDLIGWISAGDEIDGPVVYKDNAYYLHRDFYGDKNNHGTLFIDEENWNYETDTYRILYGHQFSDGTMFSGLKKYAELSYLQTYPLVEFHTLYQEEAGEYVIFSVFDASVSKLDGQYIHLRCFDDWRSGAEFRESFLEELKERSWYEIPVEVAEDDSVLCMVTCSYNDRNGRLMVFSRKLREGETAQTVTALMTRAKEK